MARRCYYCSDDLIWSDRFQTWDQPEGKNVCYRHPIGHAPKGREWISVAVFDDAKKGIYGLTIWQHPIAKTMHCRLPDFGDHKGFTVVAPTYDAIVAQVEDFLWKLPNLEFTSEVWVVLIPPGYYKLENEDGEWEEIKPLDPFECVFGEQLACFIRLDPITNETSPGIWSFMKATPVPRQFVFAQVDVAQSPRKGILIARRLKSAGKDVTEEFNATYHEDLLVKVGIRRFPFDEALFRGIQNLSTYTGVLAELLHQLFTGSTFPSVTMEMLRNFGARTTTIELGGTERTINIRST